MALDNFGYDANGFGVSTLKMVCELAPVILNYDGHYGLETKFGDEEVGLSAWLPRKGIGCCGVG